MDQPFERLRVGRLAAVIGWTLLWLAAIDVAVNLAFGPDGKSFAGLRKYFEYGRSVEGKIVRAMKADSLLLQAGWLDPAPWKEEPSRHKEGSDLMVAAYGQSFTMHAIRDVSLMDPRITVRTIGGPAAPPNHSYAAYKLDEPLRHPDVVVFGILSSSVPDLGSMTGLIWHFENPAPFTFPRYRLSPEGKLTEELPVLDSEAEFRAAFTGRTALWQRFKQQLARSDRGYDRLVFDETLADRSAIVRLLRRGWVAQRQAYEEGVYDPVNGFNADAEDIKVLQAMVLDLHRRTQARGERLVVLLLHSRGHSDHLYRALQDTLERNRIEHVSTHTLFSANDPSNYKFDGHYMPAANTKLASALLKTLRGTPPVRKPVTPVSNGSFASKRPGHALLTTR